MGPIARPNSKSLGSQGLTHSILSVKSTCESKRAARNAWTRVARPWDHGMTSLLLSTDKKSPTTSSISIQAGRRQWLEGKPFQGHRDALSSVLQVCHEEWRQYTEQLAGESSQSVLKVNQNNSRVARHSPVPVTVVWFVCLHVWDQLSPLGNMLNTAAILSYSRGR
jgi:hypothetical protein